MLSTSVRPASRAKLSLASAARLRIAIGLIGTLPVITLWAFAELGSSPTFAAAERAPVGTVLTSLPSDAIARTFTLEQGVTARSTATKAIREPGTKEGAIISDVAGASAGVLPSPSAMRSTVALIGPADLPVTISLPMVVPAGQVSPVGGKSRFGIVLAGVAYLAVFGIGLALLLSAVRFSEPTTTAAAGHANAQDNEPPPPSSNERTAEQLREDLRRLAEQLRRDVAETVHDMRTPIATILSALEPIKRVLPDDHPRAARAAAFIDISAHRLASLVDDSWNSRSALAKFFLMPREDIELQPLIQGVLDTFAAGEEFQNVHFDLQAGATCRVNAPSALLADAIASCIRGIGDDVLPGATIGIQLQDEAQDVRLRIVWQSPQIPGVDDETDPENLDDDGVPPAAVRTFTLMGGRVERGSDAHGRFLAITLPASAT